MTRQSINNVATIKDFKGHHIIASIDKATSKMSIAQNPVVQLTYEEAMTEAGRLARVMPHKKFVVLTIGAIASLQELVFE